MVKLRFIQCFCMVAALTAFGMGFGPRPIIAAEETAPVPEEDVQVLVSNPPRSPFPKGEECVALFERAVHERPFAKSGE